MVLAFSHQRDTFRFLAKRELEALLFFAHNIFYTDAAQSCFSLFPAGV